MIKRFHILNFVINSQQTIYVDSVCVSYWDQFLIPEDITEYKTSANNMIKLALKDGHGKKKKKKNLL